MFIMKGRDSLPVFESNSTRKPKENTSTQNAQMKENISLKPNETLQMKQNRNQGMPSGMPSNILHLQKSRGNRATEQWVKSRFQSTPAISSRGQAQSDVIQLRGENPHAQAGSLGGWDLTAHHIVAHSKLEKSLETLKEKEDKGESTEYTEVLIHAIPDKLTKSMLDNMKVAVEDSDEKREAYRQILIDKNRGHNEEVHNIRLGDVRKSFFEWQGGNQYMGPNTSIRAEPTSNKDDIDFDGKYFGNLSSDKFNQLTTLGGKLDQDSEKDNIATNLKAILDITKNEVPNVFDASKWTEIGSLATLNELSKSIDLNRDHILKYSFFKLGMDEIGLGKKYAEIKNESGSYQYMGLPMELQTKGTSGYIPVAKAQTIIPKEETSKTLLALLGELHVTLTPGDKKYEIPVDDDIIKLVAGKKFKVKGYDDSIPYMKAEGTTKIEAGQHIVDNRQMKVIKELDSLYTYCEKAGTATSSFLPKELYDALMAKKV